jgi:hypothetical protein
VNGKSGKKENSKISLTKTLPPRLTLSIPTSYFNKMQPATPRGIFLTAILEIENDTMPKKIIEKHKMLFFKFFFKAFADSPYYYYLEQMLRERIPSHHFEL